MDMMLISSAGAPGIQGKSGRVAPGNRRSAGVARSSQDFQVFAKPAGAVCNLDCSYCYYLEKRRLYPVAGSCRMPDSLLEKYIIQHIEASAGPAIHFSWHGGEPTVLGLDYFRKIVELQRRHRHPGRQVINGLQTNGILLEEDWCRFLAAEGFGVGLSIDGPAEMHDRCRTTRGGRRSHGEAMRAFELLRRHAVPCDILCVVQDHNVRHPSEVYRFFSEIGAPYISFLPVVRQAEGAGGAVTPHTVPAGAFGDFLCAVFDEWMAKDTGRIMVQIFDEASRPDRGLDHSLCIFRDTCGDIPVVEHNGDFFACDHFVDEEHRFGNITETRLSDLIDSPAQIAFGRAKRDALPRYCVDCSVRALCNGGCPKDRFVVTPDGEPGLNYLCADFKKFFGYSRRHLRRLDHLRQPGPARPAGILRPPVPQARRGAGTGRNDPCPCGSGRKFKKCCG